QRLQEGDAVFPLHVEDIRIQKLEHDDPHLFIAAVSESRHDAEPGFTSQFFSGDVLDHVQQLLGDEAFEFTEGLLRKNRPYVWFFFARAFAENQRTHVLKQGRGRLPQFSLQCFLTLEVRQLGQFTVRELQKGFHFVINVGAIRRGRCFFPRQQLRNVGFRHCGGTRQVSRLTIQFGQSLPNHESHIHGIPLLEINYLSLKNSCPEKYCI